MAEKKEEATEAGMQLWHCLVFTKFMEGSEAAERAQER